MKLAIRRILTIAFLLAIAAVIAMAFVPKPVVVEIVEVHRGPMQVTVDEEGQTRVRQRFVVSAPLAGRLHRIELEDGDQVDKDQTVLAVIAPNDPTMLDARARAEAEARVRQAEAAVQRAEALRSRARAFLEFATWERQRIAGAYERTGVSRHEFEAAMTAEQVAQQELRSEEFGHEMATFELEQARAVLLRASAEQPGDAVELFEIRAPITGRVFRVLQKSADVVQPGTPLIELGDPANLEIVIDVLSTDAVKIRPGAPVNIERWGGDKPLRGTVRLVEPSGFTKISALGVDEQRVNVVVDFQTPSEETISFGDGYRIEGRIVIWQVDDVVKAPTSALFRNQNEWSVFVCENGRATQRRVQVGQQNAMEGEILDGLAPGDMVILHPTDRIQPGSRVRPSD